MYIFIKVVYVTYSNPKHAYKIQCCFRSIRISKNVAVYYIYTNQLPRDWTSFSFGSEWDLSAVASHMTI